MKPYRLPINCGSFYRTLSTNGSPSSLKYVNQAQSGRDNFEKDFKKSHVETNLLQKILLGVGSGVISITSPSRGDMIAVMGEVTGYQALEYIHSKMLESDEGRRILEERPRVSSGSINLEKLKRYPDGTLGKAYSNFLERYGYTPDTRNAVKFVDDIELAYVAQRYREAHDLFHTLLDMPTNMLGEVTVKWVEAIQTKLPMCTAGALFGSVRLAPKFSRSYCTKVKTVVTLDSSLRKDLEDKLVKPKKHPGIMKVGRVELDINIVNSVHSILKKYSKRDLKREALALANVLHSRHLPVEPEQKELKRRELYRLLKEKYPKDKEESELRIAKALKDKMICEIYQWKPIKYDMYTSLKYLLARTPGEYAALMRVFNEIFKRDKNFQPTNLLDFGSGIGTVTWAANNYWGKTIREYYCVDASSDMHELAALILRNNDLNNDSAINNIYYRQFLFSRPRPYDIVVSAFSFFELPSCEQRIKTLTHLWNNTKDYLVLIENGTLAGFTVITEAREYILSISKQYGVDCYIFAPCPHEYACPRHDAPGKKIPCNFEVQYRKWSNLWRVINDTGLQRFSYVIFKKGEKPPEEERKCRIIGKVINRGKHVVCKLCTNKGELKQLVPTASKYGKPAFKCMKRSSWGDLVPGRIEQRVFERIGQKFFPRNAEYISDSDSSSDSDSDSSSDSDIESGHDNTENK